MIIHLVHIFSEKREQKYFLPAKQPFEYRLTGISLYDLKTNSNLKSHVDFSQRGRCRLMQNETYVRKLSLNERIWIASACAFPPCSNQMFLEGEEDSEMDKAKLEAAVQASSAVNPGSRVVVTGVLGGSKLVDSGKSPRVREVDGSGWDGLSDQGAPFLSDPLSPDLKEPACEVLLIHGKPLRLGFRTHHSVMDARGTGLWVADTFRVLRGEKPLGAYATVNDMDLPLSYAKKNGTKQADNLAPTGAAKDGPKGFVWMRRKLPGKRYPHLIGQIALLIAKEAWSHSEGNVTIGIPVDWRILMPPDLRSTANLSVAINVPVKPGFVPRDFTEEMKRIGMERVRGIDSSLNTLLQSTPIPIMSGLLNMMTDKMNKAGRYSYSGLITGTKGVSLEFMKGGGFNAKGMFFVPPYFGTVPLFVGFLDHGSGTQLMVTAPKVLGDAGRLEALMNRIIGGLVASDT